MITVFKGGACQAECIQLSLDKTSGCNSKTLSCWGLPDASGELLVHMADSRLPNRALQAVKLCQAEHRPGQRCRRGMMSQLQRLHQGCQQLG